MELVSLLDTLLAGNPRDVSQLTFGGVDLYLIGDVYHIDVDVPGFTKEEVNLNIEERQLIVSTVKSEGNRRKNINHKIRLPHDGSTDEIVAKHENGVLYITIPKRKVHNLRQISIE
jgi:HSP20 family protein